MKEPGAVRPPVVIVLASGRGERFRASGGAGSKLAAPLAGKTVLDHTLAAVRASGLPFHLEAAGHAGMGDTIAAGVRATADAGGWLVLPGDLPLIRPETLHRVADALSRHAVALPLCGGVRGHPVGFAASCRHELMTLTGAKGATAVVARHGALEIEVDDIGTVTDIDSLADLEAAERLMKRPVAR